MISTSEEFVLLLQKWSTEPTWVSLVLVFQEGAQRGFVHLSGCISDLDEAKSRFTIADQNHNLASFSYADCNFDYQSLDPEALERIKSLARVTGHEYEELALMVTPTKATIAIYKAKESTEE